MALADERRVIQPTAITDDATTRLAGGVLGMLAGKRDKKRKNRANGLATIQVEFSD